MSFITTRFRFIEVLMDNAAATQFFFATDATLEGAKKILAIETYSVADVTKSPATQRALVSDAVLAKSYLTIVSKNGDEELISKIPLASLSVKNYNNGIIRELNIPSMNVTKCYITVADTTGLTANTIWLLGFHYTK